MTACLYVVGYPRREVLAVALLNIHHLFVDLFGRQSSAEDGGGGEVLSVARVAGDHHVLGVEHLLDHGGHGDGAVRPAGDRRQWSESGHEEVQARERHHVDCQLAEIGVELTRETKTRRHAFTRSVITTGAFSS